MKRIDSAEVRQEGDFTAIDIIGRSFLWQMVRKIVGAIERYESGEIDLGSIESALAGEWMVLGPAPPEPLFLMDVQYEIEIRTDSRICQKVSKRLAKKLERVTLKKELFERVAEKFAERTKSQTP